MKTMNFTAKLSLLILYCILGTNFTSNSLAFDGKTFIIAGDYWCPYNCIPNSDKPGFLVELMTKALEQYGLKVEYKIMSWNQALEAIADNTIDGIIGFTDHQEGNVITTTHPLEYSTIKAYTKYGTDWRYDGTRSLQGKKLGMIAEYSMGEAVRHHMGNYYVQYSHMFIIEDGTNAVVNSIHNVISGTSDVYIEDERVVRRYLAQNNLTALIQEAGTIKEGIPLYIGFAPSIPNIKRYVQDLENGVALLKTTDQYSIMRKKYNMD